MCNLCGSSTPDLRGSFHPNPKPEKKGKKSPKPVNKIGKKGAEDIQARSENKRYMEELGITTCEAKMPGICWIDNALTFAHADKRVHLTKEELRYAIVACTPCHEVIERWPREQMRKFIMKIIEKR